MARYKTRQMGAFVADQISARIYRLRYSEETGEGYIAQTGSDITKILDIPFTFALRRVHLTHRDSSNDLCYDEMEIRVERPRGGVTESKFAQDVIHQEEDITDYHYLMTWEHLNEGGLVFEAGTFQLVLNTTSTDRVTPIIYIKRLD